MPEHFYITIQFLKEIVLSLWIGKRGISHFVIKNKINGGIKDESL